MLVLYETLLPVSLHKIIFLFIKLKQILHENEVQERYKFQVLAKKSR
jgi:hypothetical protein